MYKGDNVTQIVQKITSYIVMISTNTKSNVDTVLYPHACDYLLLAITGNKRLLVIAAIMRIRATPLIIICTVGRHQI
jgi:hypothetical protein